MAGPELNRGSENLNEAFPKPDQKEKKPGAADLLSSVEGQLKGMKEQLVEEAKEAKEAAEANENKPEKPSEAEKAAVKSPEAQQMEEEWRKKNAARPTGKLETTGEFSAGLVDILAKEDGFPPAFADKVVAYLKRKNPDDFKGDSNVQAAGAAIEARAATAQAKGDPNFPQTLAEIFVDEVMKWS